MHIYTLLYWAHFYIHSNNFFFFFETHRTNLWVTYHISFPFSQCLHAHWGKRVGSKEYLSPAICAPPWHLFTAVDYFSTFPLWARYIHTYIYCNFSSLFNFRVSFHPSTLKPKGESTPKPNIPALISVLVSQFLLLFFSAKRGPMSRATFWLLRMKSLTTWSASSPSTSAQCFRGWKAVALAQNVPYFSTWF